MCVYTRAREPLPAIYPIFCKYTSTSCNTFCGYLANGQCTFAEYSEAFNFSESKNMDERTWYLKQLASLKNKE